MVSRALAARVIICVIFKKIVIVRVLNKYYLVQTSKQVVKHGPLVKQQHAVNHRCIILQENEKT
jgi:hypothetical protein